MTLRHRSVSQDDVLEVEGARRRRYEGWSGKRGIIIIIIITIVVVVYFATITVNADYS